MSETSAPMASAFRLSPSQQIVWLHEELFPESRAYNFTATIELHGALDEEALVQSLDMVLARHAGLRLGLVPGSMPPLQRVREHCVPSLRRIDLGDHVDPERRLEELRQEHHDAPFDLIDPPLVRWCLVRMAPDHHLLLHTEHHLVHDGWSFALLLRDLFSNYRALCLGVPADLPEPRPYGDYLRYLSGREHTADRRAAVDHWRRELAGADLSPLDWRAVFPRSMTAAAKPSLDGGQLRQHLDPELATQLRTFSRAGGQTPFATLFVLFCELARRHTGRHDLVLGSAVGNRPPGFEETVGMFVNTVPLRLRLDQARPGREMIDDFTDVLIQALMCQDVPVQELTRELGLHSSSGFDNPLFSIMFSAHDAPLPTVDLPGLRVDIQEGFSSRTSRFDLDVVLIPDSRRTVNPRTEPGGMLLIWDYRADVFDHRHVKLLSCQLLVLLRRYLADPERPLADHAVAEPTR